MTEYNYQTFGCHHISQGRILKKNKQAIEHPHIEETMRNVARPMEPVKHIVEGARSYASLKGLNDPHASGYHHIVQTPERVRDLAKHYDGLPLHDRAAEPAFHAMGKEVNDQFHHLTHTMGIKAEFVDHDPYKNSHEMAHDLRQNKRIQVLRTAKTGGHPFFSNEDNDKFRAVHDAFGHAGTGRDFDGHGEEAAWLAHHRMFSSKAQGALASETRGQNGSVIAHSEFGPQKIALMPRRLWTPDSSHEAMLKTAGANGPDYTGLQFKHDYDDWGDGEGNGKLTAHHPDAVNERNPDGKVGTLTYEKQNHFGEDHRYGGYVGPMIHIDHLKAHTDHMRRGVASQLMSHLEGMHKDIPVDHGKRTPAGKAWAESQYGEHDHQFARDMHITRAPTLNGKYLEPAHGAIKQMRPSELTDFFSRDLEGAHNRRKIEDLKDSFRQHGYDQQRSDRDPIKLYQDPDNPQNSRLSDGHHRIKALTEYGWNAPINVHTSSVMDDYRDMRADQERRVEHQTGYLHSDRNRPEVKAFFGDVDSHQADHVEKPVTLKNFIKWRGSEPKDVDDYTRGHAHGYDHGSGRGVDHNQVSHDRESSQNPEHFDHGYEEGWNLGLSHRTANSSIYRREVVRKHLASFNKVAVVTDKVAVLIREAVKDRWIQYDLPSMIRLGHVSGNQVDILHCPFCGSGSLVARSDGTVECGFCTAVYTVQVQPQYAAFPQTVEGQPYPWPGRPNDLGQVSPDLPGDQAIGGDPIDGEDNDGDGDGGNFGPDDGDDVSDHSEDDDDSDSAPPFAKKKSYRTAKGNVLTRDQYIAHLAIINANNRQRVLAGMREQ